MRAFTYHVPTEVVFGPDAELEAARLVKKYGGSRVLVVYGGGSAVKSGLLDRITGKMTEEGLAWETIGGVKANPRVALAREGIRQAIAMKADFILGVGGGSVIDTAKAIAHGTANPELDIWDGIWTKPANLKKSLPVGAVPTIPAAGSETSDSAVLTDEEGCGQKRGLSTQLNRPAFAAINPALAATLPPYQVACGVTDIMMHTLDRYFNCYTDNDITDEFAEGLLRVVIRHGQTVVRDPSDLRSMSEIVWCSSLSHNGLTGLGGIKDFIPHRLSQALGAKFDKAHGACLAAIWGSWARFVYKDNPERFARYAKNVWDIDQSFSVEEAALAGIAANEAFFESLGMPTGIPALVGRQEPAVLDELTELCFPTTDVIGTFKKLDRKMVREIFELGNNKL